jgi:hypothetical protein
VPPDFLNSREDAMLLWATLILACVTYKGPSIWLSFFGLARLMFASKLTLLFGSAAVYSVAVVLLAKNLGLWHMTALKETIYWFVGTGVILVGDATGATPDPGYFRRILRRALTFTIIIEFVVNLYVFPLIVEVPLVGLIFPFFGMQAVAQYEPKIDARNRRVIDGVLVALGLFLLGSFVISALFDLDRLLTREMAERFFMVPALTLTFIPFLYAVAWYCRRELENLRRHFRAAPTSPA